MNVYAVNAKNRFLAEQIPIKKKDYVYFPIK
jgi:hypothetical protein